MDTLDAVTETDVGPVGVAAGEEWVVSGRDATANFLAITVAKEVMPAGVTVTVVWSARTTATLGAFV